MADPMAKLLGDAGMADDAGDDDGSGKLDAAKDLIAAVKAGDAEAVSLALERHYEACKAGESEPDEDDSEEY